MFKSAIRRLLSLDDPPERTALAFAIGVFIAFSPFLGLHTIMAVVIAFLFRFNKVAIFTGTFVNNPFLTLIPIVIASYAVGAFLMGQPLGLPDESRELLLHPRVTDRGYWRTLLVESRSVLVPFALGGTVLSIVFSLLAYPLMLRVLRARRGQTDGAVAEARDENGESHSDEKTNHQA